MIDSKTRSMHQAKRGEAKKVIRRRRKPILKTPKDLTTRPLTKEATTTSLQHPNQSKVKVLLVQMNPVAEADPLPVKHQATKAMTAERRRFPKPHPQAM